LKIRRVLKLTNKEGAGLFGNAFRDVLVVFRVAFANIRSRGDNLNAKRAKMEDLLLAHLVRNNERELVPTLRCNQRK
jgi:hypothetical protein